MSRFNTILPGAVVLLLGLLGVFWIVPEYVMTPGGTGRGAVGPDIWPRSLMIFITILGVLLLITELKSMRQADASTTTSVGLAKGRGAVGFIVGRSVLAFGALVAYALLLEPLGMPIASALAFVVFALLAGERRPAVIGVMAILIPVALHLFFSKIAQVQMPMGLLQ